MIGRPALAGRGLGPFSQLGLGGGGWRPKRGVVDRLQHEARGIYALWGQESPAMAKIMALPFIHGSQIVMQWAEVEPQRGQYDFTALDHELEKLNREGLWTTLQINGNLKRSGFSPRCRM